LKAQHINSETFEAFPKRWASFFTSCT